MTKVILLEQLGEFTRKHTGGLLLPVAWQKEDKRQPAPRAAEVFLTRLPDSGAARKKAPYILHQVVTGKDSDGASTAAVRSIFCVHHQDEEQGGLALLNLMEQFRVPLLQWPVLGGQFRLDLKAGAETLIYPENLAPYYAGEMLTNWLLPPVRRQDTLPVTGGLPAQDPWGNRRDEIIGQKGRN